MTDKLLPEQFAIGLLSPRERADATRQRLCDAELDLAINNLEATLSPLAGMAGCIEPPAGLRGRVLNAVSKTHSNEAQGKLHQPFVSGAWRNVFPGVDVKQLWASGPKLLRCAPISAIPAHEHLEDEYLAVLAGDFSIEGCRYELGDYLFSPRGTRHEQGTTQSGCLLLLHEG